MQRCTSIIVRGGWVLAFAFAPAGLAVAKPLDSDTCIRLKLQRDELEKSGVRAALSETPPGRSPQALDDRARQMRTLIDLDGQLRFRCAMGLPIVSLRPELLVEPPETVDGEPAAKPAVKPKPKPRPERQAKPPAAPADGATPAAGEGTPAQPNQKTAGTKPAPKARPKADDTYRPPATPKTE